MIPCNNKLFCTNAVALLLRGRFLSELPRSFKSSLIRRNFLISLAIRWNKIITWFIMKKTIITWFIMKTTRIKYITIILKIKWGILNPCNNCCKIISLFQQLARNELIDLLVHQSNVITETLNPKEWRKIIHEARKECNPITNAPFA